MYQTQKYDFYQALKPNTNSSIETKNKHKLKQNQNKKQKSIIEFGGRFWNPEITVQTEKQNRVWRSILEPRNQNPNRKAKSILEVGFGTQKSN